MNMVITNYRDINTMDLIHHFTMVLLFVRVTGHQMKLIVFMFFFFFFFS